MGECLGWLRDHVRGVEEIEKSTLATRAWFGELAGREVFLKWYPPERWDTWTRTEIAISRGGLHAAIVPLFEVVRGEDGDLLIYERVRGENLGGSEARARFARVSVEERFRAVLSIGEALAAVFEAGYTVVDWYEGNTLYDFEDRRVWLFDWELCREGSGFELEMDSNYGSSKLMAPEEFLRGSRIDEATLVFNLGRYALLTVPELAERAAGVLARATYPARAGRYSRLREFLGELGAEV